MGHLKTFFEDKGGGEFDQSNFKKFKFPGSARGGGGMLKFRIDRYINVQYIIVV